MKQSEHRFKVLTPAESQKMKAQQALIEAEMPELIRIGLQWKHEHETMIREIVTELKEARRAAGLSLADMQATTGMDRAELSRLLGDGDQPNRNPSLSTLERIAAAVGRRLKLTLTDRS